ncbi:MAG: FG-GAP repeat protein, partial [Planctomycetes bacterium]|nr:FG-GAP repeat protein [Planctomycetota bacterium]
MLRWNLSASAFCGLGLICCDSLPAQTPTPGVDSIYTGAGGDRFGYRIESADLNADGVDDLVVGAPHQSGGNMVYVFFGPVQLPSGPELPVSAADVEIEGPPGSETGWSLATGDVVAGNEDDLIIGAPVLGGSDGAVHVFAGPIAPGHYTTAMADLTVEGHRRGYAGWAVTAGDFDRDGKDELCVGAPTAGNLGSQVGEVYVMDVDTAIGPKISTSTATCTLLGVGVTGTAMCNGGDINGDGFEDLLVGSYGAAMTSGHSFGGTVHLVYGRSSFRPSYDLKFSVISGIANINGEFDGHNVGYAVAPAGDVNRDGYDDFLIGAPGFLLGSEPGGVEDAGSAYLVLGARDLIGTPQLYGDHRVGTVADLIFVGSGIG